MSKKPKTFKTLSLSTLPKVTAASLVEVVEVPEFGEGMTVNARPLTVEYHSLLGMYLAMMGVDSNQNGGQPPKHAAAAYQAMNAALGSYDDDGNLVFGETPDEAIVRVRSLPAQYGPAIRRISAVVTRLTGNNNPQRSVEEAEKN
ncbi:MAG: hypothetical protein KDK05_33330 [Candidatus Competibacteraceae bacterium]|nr:hypothetical protein [Candidatus Competibacteraceae bacterium]